jgi:tRNA(Ile2) C34 agmatinyltransferase TiaS
MIMVLCVVLVVIFGQILTCNATICEYCGKDFKSLGRHQWRCKLRTGVGNSPNTERASSSTSEDNNTCTVG